MTAQVLTLVDRAVYHQIRPWSGDFAAIQERMGDYVYGSNGQLWQRVAEGKKREA